MSVNKLHSFSSVVSSHPRSVDENAKNHGSWGIDWIRAEAESTGSETVNKSPFQKLTWRQILGFIVGLLCQIGAGAPYAFSTFSDDLKTQENFSQSEINLVGELQQTGQYLGPLSGMLFFVFGTRKSATFCGVCMFLGYFLAYLVTSGGLEALKSSGGLGFCFMIVGIGGQTMSLTALSSNVQNLPPEFRGMVVALQIAFLNVASPLFTKLYSVIFNASNVSGMFLFISIFTFTTGILGAIFLLPAIHLDQKGDPLLEDVPEEEGSTNDSKTVTQKEDSSISLYCTQIWKTILMLASSSTYWMIFCIYFIVEGVVLFLAVNTGNLIKSLNNNVDDNNILFINSTIYTFVGLAGRFTFGTSDYFRIKRGWYIFGGIFMLGLGMLLDALVINSDFTRLYGISALSGFATAASASGVHCVVSEYWGAALFPQTFGWMLLAAVPSSYVFNAIAGAFYDHQINVHHDRTGVFPIDPETQEILPNDCIGADCFRGAFYFAFGTCVVGLVISLILLPRTEYGLKSDEDLKNNRSRIHSNTVSIRHASFVSG